MPAHNVGFANDWSFASQTGIPASSGYPQYQGTALMPPLVSMNILARYYATSIFQEIATTEYEGDLRKHGTIYFLKEPDPIIRDYQKNAKIIYDTAEIEMVPLTVGKAFQAGLKVDKIDANMIQMWPRIERLVIDKVPQAMMRKIDFAVFSGLYNEIAPFNRGSRAGRNGDKNLGEFGAPISVDKDNIIELIWRIAEVLDEAAIPRQGRFLVVPPSVFTLIAMSDLGCAYCAGGNSSIRLTGKIPADMVGFTILSSPYLPVYDDSGRQSFHIFAGLKTSLAFATIINDSEIIENDPYEYTRFVRVIGAYGYGVLYPEALAAAYVTIQ